MDLIESYDFTNVIVPYREVLEKFEKYKNINKDISYLFENIGYTKLAKKIESCHNSINLLRFPYSYGASTEFSCGSRFCSLCEKKKSNKRRRKYLDALGVVHHIYGVDNLDYIHIMLSIDNSHYKDLKSNTDKMFKALSSLVKTIRDHTKRDSGLFKNIIGGFRSFEIVLEKVPNPLKSQKENDRYQKYWLNMDKERQDKVSKGEYLNGHFHIVLVVKKEYFENPINNTGYDMESIDNIWQYHLNKVGYFQENRPRCWINRAYANKKNGNGSLPSAFLEATKYTTKSLEYKPFLNNPDVFRYLNMTLKGLRTHSSFGLIKEYLNPLEAKKFNESDIEYTKTFIFNKSMYEFLYRQ